MVLENGSRVGRSPFRLSTPGLEMGQVIVVVYRKESKNSASSSVFPQINSLLPLKNLKTQIRMTSSIERSSVDCLNKQGNICIKTL